MNLTEEQKNAVAQWVAAGATLSEVQTKIAADFGVKMTYMDVRFLVDDLNLELQDKAESKPVPAPASVPATQPIPSGAANPHEVADEDEVPAGTPAAAAAAEDVAKVSVTVDPVQVAGVLVGGGVRFSDGVRGQWFVDEAGRLGLDGLPANYRPTQQDAQEFRVLLAQELRKLGLA